MTAGDDSARTATDENRTCRRSHKAFDLAVIRSIATLERPFPGPTRRIREWRVCTIDDANDLLDIRRVGRAEDEHWSIVSLTSFGLLTDDLRFRYASTDRSEAQFQFVKFFAAVASTPAHLDAVQALRDGGTTLAGLEIDTDLAWELLIALVAGGRAGSAEIDAALAADNTATGAQSAANARAAIPTAEAKRAAWDSVTTDDSAPNTIVRSTGLGFQRTSDPAVLDAMVPVYFDSLRSLWDSKSYKIAEYLVVGFYPAVTPTQAIVDATRAWLDANPEVPALRRLIIENGGLHGTSQHLSCSGSIAG